MSSQKEEERAAGDNKMRSSANKHIKTTFRSKKAMGIAIALVAASCYISGLLSF